MINEIKSDIEARMESSVRTARSEMSGIRAGRASQACLTQLKLMPMGKK